MQKSSKGQYFSFDAIMATMVFLLAISLLSNYWFGVRAAAEKGDDTYKEALRISDALMGTGVPQNWQAGGPAYSFGLATTNKTAELDKNKTERFIQMLNNNLEYPKVREGLRTSEQINVTVEELSSDPLPYYVSGGHSPDGATTALKVVRIATMDTLDNGKLKPVKVTLIVWNDRR